MRSIGTGRDDSALLRAAFEVGPDAVLVFDRQRIAVHANAPARRLFAEDIVGLSPARRAERWTFRDEAGRLMPMEVSPSARGLRGETVRDTRCELVLENGDHRYLSVDAFPLRDDAGVVDGVVCVLRERPAAAAHAGPRLFEGQPSWVEAAARLGGADARLRVVADAGRAVGTSPDYASTLVMLARAAVPALADWCVIRVVEADGRVDRLPTIYSDPAHAAAAHAMDEYYATRADTDAYTPAAGIGRVIRTGEPVLVPQMSLGCYGASPATTRIWRS